MSPDTQTTDTAEISLIDIALFLKGAYKNIVISGAVGLLLAVAYLVFTPKQYVAAAQITMAQIANNNINPLGINIEDSAALINRMSSPTSFSQSQVAACDLTDSKSPLEALTKTPKWTIPKGVANTVELKVSASSPETARACVNSLVMLVQDSQKAIALPYIQEAKDKLASAQEKLDAAKKVIAQADRSGAEMGAVYLSTRDEVRYLLDEMTSLRNLIGSDERRGARLVTPIYASDVAVSPKKRITLIAGLFAGLFVGLLIALAGIVMPKLRAALGGSV